MTTVFTRVSWSYWGDRLTVFGIFIIMGATLIGAGISVTRGGNPYEMPTVFSIPIGILLILAGLWFSSRPFPIAVEIDDNEIRVQYKPQKTVTIPRKNFIRARWIIHAKGTGSYRIFFNENGKERYLSIGDNFVDQDGAHYPREKIVDAINKEMKIR